MCAASPTWTSASTRASPTRRTRSRARSAPCSRAASGRLRRRQRRPARERARAERGVPWYVVFMCAMRLRRAVRPTLDLFHPRRHDDERETTCTSATAAAASTPTSNGQDARRPTGAPDTRGLGAGRRCVRRSAAPSRLQHEHVGGWQHVTWAGRSIVRSAALGRARGLIKARDAGGHVGGWQDGTWVGSRREGRAFGQGGKEGTGEVAFSIYFR